MPEEFKSSPPLLPPWSRKKRIKVAVKMTGIILVAALGLGLGLGFLTPLAPPTLSKVQIIKALLMDKDFIKATKKAAVSRKCVNTSMKFSINYEPPNSPIDISSPKACLVWLLTNPNGGMTQINLSFEALSRAKLVASITSQMSQVSTQMIRNEKGNVSMIEDVKNNQIQYWILELGNNKSLKIAVTNPNTTLNGKVMGLINGFSQL